MEVIRKPSLSEFIDVFSKTFGDSNYQKLCVKSVTFVVTQDCTLRCSYCYETHKNPDHDMTFETGKKIVDLLFEEDSKNSKLINKNNAKCIILDFIGGEPLLKIDLIDQIVDYFLEKAHSLHHRWELFYTILITSNGTEYFSKKVQNFAEKYKGRLNMGITVDGNKFLHDSCRKFIDGRPSYDIANAALIDCLKKGYTTNTKITISQQNLPYLSDAIINMLDYPNMKTIAANVVFEARWTIENAKLFYEELKKLANYVIENKTYSNSAITFFDETIGKPKKESDNRNWCGGTGDMLAFDSDGNIYPCLRYVPLSLRYRDSRDYILGTLEKGLLSEEKNKKTIDFLDSITRKTQSTEECFNCPIAEGCAWCSGWNFDLYGTPNKRCTFICPMHKARVLANAYYWNSLYRKLNMPNRFKINIPDKWALEIINDEELNYLKEISKNEQ
jgi:uncharacterized protein